MSDDVPQIVCYFDSINSMAVMLMWTGLSEETWTTVETTAKHYNVTLSRGVTGVYAMRFVVFHSKQERRHKFIRRVAQLLLATLTIAPKERANQ